MDWSFTIVGILAQRYFADAGLRSDGATASTMAFFSAGVRSRIGPPEAAPLSAEVGTAAAVAAAPSVPLVAQPESPRLTANAAITLNLATCTFDPSLKGGGLEMAA